MTPILVLIMLLIATPIAFAVFVPLITGASIPIVIWGLLDALGMNPPTIPEIGQLISSIFRGLLG